MDSWHGKDIKNKSYLIIALVLSTERTDCHHDKWGFSYLLGLDTNQCIVLV